jgi:hypothetical protein
MWVREVKDEKERGPLCCASAISLAFRCCDWASLIWRSILAAKLLDVGETLDDAVELGGEDTIGRWSIRLLLPTEPTGTDENLDLGPSA